MELKDPFVYSEETDGVTINEPVDFEDINLLWNSFHEDLFKELDIDGGTMAETINSALPDKLVPDLPLTLIDLALIKNDGESGLNLFFSIGFDECTWEIIPALTENGESFFVLNSFVLDVNYNPLYWEISLHGKATLKGHSFEVKADFPSGYFELSLGSNEIDSDLAKELFSKFDFNPNEAFGLEEGKELKGQNLLVRAYPKDKIFCLNLDFKDLKFNGFSTDIHAEIQYVDKKFEASLSSNIYINQLTPGKAINLRLGGNLAYDNGQLYYGLFGAIALENYSLSDLISSLSGQAGENIELHPLPFSSIVNPSLSEIGLMIEMPQKHFLFNIEMTNVFQISHENKTIFALDKISLLLDFNPSNEEKKFTGELAALMILPGDMHVFVSASNSKEGWEFIGQLEEDWDLGKMVVELLDIELPEKLTTLIIEKDSSIKYQSKSGRFEIAASSKANISIPIGNDDQNLNIELNKINFIRDENKQIEFSLSGKATLKKSDRTDGLQLDVKFDYKEGNWSLSGELVLDGITLETQIAQIFKVPENQVNLPQIIGAQKPSKVGVGYNSEDGSLELVAEVKAENLDFNVKSSLFKLQVRKAKNELLIQADLELIDNSGEIYRFLLAFSKGKTSNSFIATYKGHFSVLKVIKLLSGNSIENMPKWLNPTMDGATFLVTVPKGGGSKRVLFALEGGMEFDWQSLEFAGKFLPKGKEKVQLKLVMASEALDGSNKEDLKEIRSLIKEVNLENQIVIPDSGLQKGFLVGITIESQHFSSLNTTYSIQHQQDANGKASKSGEGTSKTEWKEVEKKNRTFGPVSIEKFGLTIEEGKFKILVDGGITMGGFTFNLMDLAVSIPLSLPLDVKKMEFGLSGLALKYKTPSFQLSGAFLHQKVSVPYKGSNILVNGYFGEAFLAFQGKSFRAMGAYINLPDAPSFFLYLVVNVPIGGPSYFYVNGFAVGFGINSKLNIPQVDTVRDFVLVKAAMGEENFDKASPSENLKLIQRDIVPMAGSYWIAIGLKVMHVKILQSFFLATVQFGKKLEISLLGLTKLILPPPGDSIVRAELQMKAQYIPDDGFLSIEGRLSPNSFILSPKARLTGGFAFCAWFKGSKAGDFVLSMGGYHPRFRRPDHYPNVPRIGVNWQVTSNIFIKGEEYYALTPGSFMAGGRLEARAEVGPIEASFTAEAHFMVNFSPFQYVGNVSVNLAASFYFFGKHTVHIGASVDLWGPPFAGRAIVDLGLFDLEIEFGPAKKPPLPISWQEFSGKFLPAADSVLSIDIGKGLIREIPNPSHPDSGLWILNPNDFELNFETAIPVKTIELNKTVEYDSKEKWEIGIAPMNLSKENFNSNMVVTIFQEGKLLTDDSLKLGNNFKKRAEPKALWGKFREENYNGKSLTLNESTAGFSIIPNRKIISTTSEVYIKSLLWKQNRHLIIKIDWQSPTFIDFEDKDEVTISSPTKSYLSVLESLVETESSIQAFEFIRDDYQLMESVIFEKPIGAIINMNHG